MTPSGFADSLAQARARKLAIQARWLRALSMICQIGLMAALLVMWKQFKMPFAQAFEKCFVGGVLIYVVLGTAASILMSLARLQPVHMLLRQLLGIVSLLVFGALHYAYGLGIMKSAAAWVVIYVAARILVRRIENRAMRRFGVA